jgi:hypothetical protein
MAFLKIVILGLVAACLYGIAQNQVTVRVCIEYFTIGHRPISPTESPTLLALVWGIVATWWVGLPLGLLLAVSSRLGRWPRLSWRKLLRPVAIVLGVMALVSLAAGIAGYHAARAGHVWLLEPLASKVPADRHTLFLADLWAHIAAYLAGLLGGIALCAWCVFARWRHQRMPNSTGHFE